MSTNADGYHVLSTKLGDFAVRITEKRHACVSNDRVVIRGVENRIWAHLYQYADGAWHIGDENAKWDAKYHSLSARKIASFEDSTQATRKLVTEVVETAFNEWAGANPALFDAAEANYIADAIERREEAIRERREQIAGIEAELVRLRNGEHLPTHTSIGDK